MPRPSPVPVHHPRPVSGWMNDPNGLVRWDGRWHVFFQHNPDAPVHHRICWGHLSSADLVTWHEHPVAFGPQPGGPDRHGCWTGVFAPGLERPAVVYSGVVDDTFRSTVCLRYARDEALETWDAPTVVATTPQEVGVRVMRDPFLVHRDGRRWALLGAGLDDGRPAVLLFDADVIDHWVYLGVWFVAPAGGELAQSADIWECPQLLRVDDEPVLILSTQLRGELGEVIALRGSDPLGPGTQFDWDGRVSRLDAGDVFYAPQAALDPDEAAHPVLFGWVRQRSAEGMPAPDSSAMSADEVAVAGCLTLPRRLAIVDDVLRCTVDPAVRALVDRHPRTLGPGEHELTEACLVRTVTGSAHLLGRAIRCPVVAGTEVWVDAEVLEVFPAFAGAPTTIRDEQTASWRLDVAPGGVVEVAALAAPR